MRLLIVDDSHEKVEKISKAVSASMVHTEITHETNAAAARRRLNTEIFDLLLIDLQLPEVAGAIPNRSGGINFFDILVKDTKSLLPIEILFITSEEGLITEGQEEVLKRGGTLCAISNINVTWMAALIGRITLASNRAHRRVEGSDIALITALGSELDAVLNLDYSWSSFRIPGDPTLYHRGAFETAQGLRHVVAASALRKGMAASAALATKLVLKFSPKILAMTGICAGVRVKTNLGDVIVGAPTWDWGSGKNAENDDGSKVFRLSPKQSDLNNELATLCYEIGIDSQFKKRVRANWTEGFPAGNFNCHVGPMASGASVIASESTAGEIVKQNRDLLGIEMEAFAVMVATEYATSVPTLGIAIKSVCDYADREKEDGWQSFAAYTSTIFADELFKRYFESR